MAKVEAELRGAAEMFRALYKLNDKMRAKVTSAAIRKGVRPIINDARSRVPRESGLLRKSIGYVVRTYRGGETTIGVIGGTSNVSGNVEVAGRTMFRWPVKYAHLVEHGTRPHAQPRNRRYSRSGHPGSTAKPFLEPAFESKHSEALQAMADEISRRLFE